MVLQQITPGKKVWVINNPGVVGELTGQTRCTREGTVYVEIRLPDGTIESKKLSLIREGSNRPSSILDCYDSGSFGLDRDLRCLLVLQRIKGDLSDHLYSMQVGRLDFMPHQFRPVIKFLKSPTERLLIADEVGLGKTIEAILIWLELQARRKARRLLIVCPNMLVTKWRDELRLKFDLPATITSAGDLLLEHKELVRKGPAHSFIKIATYSSLRPSREEWRQMKDKSTSERAKFLNLLKSLDSEDEPPFFDLVIMDEAHYLRNPESMVSKLGELIAKSARGLVLLSATPVSNSSSDLLTLLRLLDPDFFKNNAFFDSLVSENAPALSAVSALMATPHRPADAAASLARLTTSKFVGESALLKNAIEQLKRTEVLDSKKRGALVDSVEQLNVLGSYYSRTRRVHVEKERPLRYPKTLEVTFSEREMAFYRRVEGQVRQSLKAKGVINSAFFLIHPQMRMSSCLPAMADAYRRGDFGSPEEFEELSNGNEDDHLGAALKAQDWSWMREYDFRGTDSKFLKLKEFLLSDRGHKKIIFAFYKGTLDYLYRHIQGLGIPVELIHGAIELEDRLQAIERFKTDPAIDILLSSEVGSEGLDLQFCNTLINYDLPWNPMRIEQRIGRIDRIGQKAKRLVIYNFKIKGTIEERLYDILNRKLKIFESSLGSVESVIGDSVEDWHIRSFRDDLTPAEEERLLEQGIAASGYLEHIKDELEQESTHLMGLSSVIERQISDASRLSRFVSASDLRQFINDFFATAYVGTVLRWTGADRSTFDLVLTFEGRESLEDFIKIQQLPALLLQQNTFRGLIKDNPPPIVSRKDGELVNHFHPLIRWMVSQTDRNENAGFPSASLTLDDAALAGELDTGIYVYHLRFWSLRGFRHFNQLAFLAYRLEDKKVLEHETSERLIKRASQIGQSWPGQYVLDTVKRRDIEAAHHALEDALLNDWDDVSSVFTIENENLLSIKKAQIFGRHAHRKSSVEKQIDSLREKDPAHKLIKASEAQLRRANEVFQASLAKLERSSKIRDQNKQLGFGIIKLVNSSAIQ